MIDESVLFHPIVEVLDHPMWAACYNVLAMIPPPVAPNSGEVMGKLWGGSKYYSHKTLYRYMVPPTSLSSGRHAGQRRRPLVT